MENDSFYSLYSLLFLLLEPESEQKNAAPKVLWAVLRSGGWEEHPYRCYE